MAGNNAEMSTSQSAQRDIQGAINMGKSAAQTAKTVQKVAAQAASGNFAGAAVSLLKDPATLKKVLVTALIIILIPIFLLVFCLYALPTMIYEAVVSFFSEVGEQWSIDTYGGDGGVVWEGIKASFAAVGNVIADAAKGLWNGLVGLFTSDSGDVDDGSEQLVDDEFYVTQESGALLTTVELKVAACQKKIEVRAKQIYDAIYAQRGSINNYFKNKYSTECDEWAGTNITIMPNPNTGDDLMMFSKRSAVELLSAYTVMTEASVSDIKLSDFIKWLGYYNEFDSGNTYFGIGGPSASIQCSVKAWKGRFMPQYLVEQQKYEIHTFGSEITDFNQYMCPAIDMLLVVSSPDFDDVQPVFTEVERVRYVYNEETEELDEETYIVIVGSANVLITIGARNAESLSQDVIGFWGGKLP